MALDPDAIAGSLPVGLRQRLEILKALRSGADIAASDFIHRRFLALKEAGTAILLVSADLDEIRTLADRILVMEGGRIAGALGPAASERELGLLMGGSAR